jgi:pyruvate dehydrogenase E1 component beta subunit
VIEMRIADFTLCAMDELVSQIAKVRYMFGGQGRASLVVRMPQGMWRNSAAQHSQCLEAWLTHIPGLVVAAPGTPADAAGLLRAAIRSDDPVVLMEPKNLWTTEGEVPDEVAPIPFGVARRAAAGDAVTVVTWSATVPVVEQGARESGVACDVFDLRSLWPWDEASVVASARPMCSTCAACGRGTRLASSPRRAAPDGCSWCMRR